MMYLLLYFNVIQKPVAVNAGVRITWGSGGHPEKVFGWLSEMAAFGGDGIFGGSGVEPLIAVFCQLQSPQRVRKTMADSFSLRKPR
jgi:hypothetical protein